MSDQVKLPKGVERFSPPRIGKRVWPEGMEPDPHGPFIDLFDLPAILAQRDQEWRDGLLGEEAVKAAARNRWPLWIAMKPEQRAAALKVTRADLQAALNKAAPDGGGEGG